MPNKYQAEQRALSIVCQNKSTHNSLDKKLYLVTGLDGCNACLEHTVKFIEENSNNEDMIFIISGKSKLQLKSKFRPETIRKSNFVLDTALIALKYRLVDSGFPKLYLCRDNKIVEVFEVTYVNADELFSYAKSFTKT